MDVAAVGTRPNVVVGAGIVGLATARALLRRDPERPVVVLDKEPRPATHQTGHNSGVIHSGLYYKPGSLKARLAVQGAEALKRFCDQEGIRYDVPGKLVVATRASEIAALERLLVNGTRNGVPVRRATPDEISQREPSLNVAAALIVETTGRVNYTEVAAAFVSEIEAHGGAIRYGSTVRSVRVLAAGAEVHTDDGALLAHRVACCAGLHSDRLARASGLDPGVKILPFRGEYSELVPERDWLVKGLVYPVPDPELPFLGVHLTRGLDGKVHIGPNAVPALAREGYSWSTVVLPDVIDTVTYPGTWRLARQYGRTGIREISRSLAGRSLVKAARAMLPDLTSEDIKRSGAGVRAQAVTRDGRLVDDFRFMRNGPSLHVLNAPSPAATACLPIGEMIAAELVGSTGAG